MTTPSDTIPITAQGNSATVPYASNQSLESESTGESASDLSLRRRIHLGLEMILIFTLAPVLLVALRYYGLSGVLFPAIWAFAIGCAVFLHFDRSFDRKSYWRFSGLKKELPRILAIFAAGVVFMFAIVMYFIPDQLFYLPRRAPQIWVIVMFGYPILSVYAQGVIYRVYLFHRYKQVFKSQWSLIIVAAFFFSFAHVVMGNWVAMILTLGGGFLFSWTYTRSQSALAAWLEHSLYGCMLFSIGMGVFIFAGNRQAAREAPKYRYNIEQYERYKQMRKSGAFNSSVLNTAPRRQYSSVQTLFTESNDLKIR